MSEFNGKKYYGFSLHNDPALLTTTRNFEFRYTRPENLDRVIQKVQLSDGAEAKQKKILLAKYCKIKKPSTRELNAPFKSRDLDVETHMSRNDVKKVRELSENEIDQLIGKARSTISMVTADKEIETALVSETDDALPLSETFSQAEDLVADMTCNMRTIARTEEDVETPREEDVEAPIDEFRAPLIENVVIEEIRMPHPQWVEIEENSACAKLTMVEVKEPQHNMVYRSETKTLSLPAFPLQKLQQCQQRQLLMPHPPLKLLTQSQTQTSMQKTTQFSPEDMDPNAYYVEDSDYEYEMLKRPDYTKYCEKRPKLDDMTNVSNESGVTPRFIEIEHQIPCMDLSFLKNTKPIRYTDLTDDIPDEERLDNQELRVFIKGVKKEPADKKPVTKKKPHDKEGSKQKSFTPKNSSKSSTPTSLKTPQQSPRSKQIKHQKIEIPSPTNSAKSRKNSKSPRTPKDANSDRSKMAKIKNIILTRSLEELKLEKVSLFAKMNTTQERIIDILDKLRMSLLEIYVPESSFDKNRRQKNAFEFSVRFSRNFLYPLKGMVEDLRTTTKEQLNSTSSNDACIRVASIYALILQSLQTYQRQLRFFMLDKVPQKLTALIEMIQMTTHLCLDKSIFDLNDPIIECLQDRCSKFIGFLQDLQEERFVSTARGSNIRKPPFEKASSSPKTTKVQAKYDLKMFMNDLNMYEPKLVPKRHPVFKIRCKGGTNSASNSGNSSVRKRKRKIGQKSEEELQKSPLPDSSEMVLTRAAEDAISTHIGNLSLEGSSGLLTSVQNMVATSNDCMPEKSKCDTTTSLNKAVIEALQLVTKEQVRQVLEPIIQTLGSALDKKDFECFMLEQLNMHKQLHCLHEQTLKELTANEVTNCESY